MVDIIPFLIRAKQATYAGNGAHVASCRPNSKDLSYQEDDLSYYDTYLGGSHFIGEEAVWSAGNPCWAMNYSGRLLDNSFSFDFLKEALLHASPEMPYRGPELYQQGDLTYKCSVHGEFTWFYGYEEIYFLVSIKPRKFAVNAALIGEIALLIQLRAAVRHFR